MKRAALISSSLASLLALSACASDATPTAQLRVFLTTDATLPMAGPTDAMGDSVDVILVQPVSLEFHHETEGWQLLWDEGTMVDLLADNSWLPVTLGNTVVPAGEYDAMRWTFGMTEIVGGGDAHHLTLMGAEGPEVELPLSFCLDDGALDDLHLDWEVDDALGHDAELGYTLVPRIDAVMPPECEE